MPFKSEYTHQKIPRHLDRRVKLSLQDREQIKQAYGHISQRKLAKLFNVSRSTIVFIGNPDAHKQNLLRRKERGGSMIYYDKAKQILASRKVRAYRRKLDKQGILTKLKNEAHK